MPSYLDNLSTFSSVIVSRGRSYFRSGMVLSLSHSGNQVNAVVEGSGRNEYQVHLTFAKDGYTLLRSDCSCPYFDDCKHVVAVLYALEEERLHGGGDISHPLSKESFLRGLKGWSRKTSSNCRYDFFIRELLSLMKNPDIHVKEEDVVSTFAEIEYGLYLRSMKSRDVYSLALLSFLDLLPQAKLSEDSFVSMSFAYVEKEKLPIKNLLFSLFLSNVSFSSAGVSYFLDVYKANQSQAKRLLNNLNAPLKDNIVWDVQFLKIVAVLRPYLLDDAHLKLLFSDSDIWEDKNLLLSLLNVFSRSSNRPPFFYSLLEKALPLLKEGEIVSLFQSLFAMGINLDDAFFLLLHLPKEVLALGFSKVSLIKYHPIHSTVAFFCYPAFGEYSLKELHPCHLWRIRSVLSDAQKETVLQASSLFLEKKRFASHDLDVYGAFYWLADFKVMNALALMKEKRFENFFYPNSIAGNALRLYLESSLLTEGERSFILYKGDPYVSL